MTIDLEEIYIGVLKRGCALKVVSVEEREKKLCYFVEITEKDGVTYVVTLWENPIRKRK